MVARVGTRAALHGFARSTCRPFYPGRTSPSPGTTRTLYGPGRGLNEGCSRGCSTMRLNRPRRRRSLGLLRRTALPPLADCWSPRAEGVVSQSSPTPFRGSQPGGRSCVKTMQQHTCGFPRRPPDPPWAAPHGLQGQLLLLGDTSVRVRGVRGLCTSRLHGGRRVPMAFLCCHRLDCGAAPLMPRCGSGARRYCSTTSPTSLSSAAAEGHLRPWPPTRPHE